MSKKQSVFITGATGGIGRALAEAYAARGASLILTYRDDAKRAELARAVGDGARFLHVDLADATSLDRACEEVTSADVVLNVAGVGAAALLEATSPQQIEAMIAVDLRAPIRLCHAALPAMIARREGLLVNVASVNALLHSPLVTVYAAAKAGLAAFTHALRRETIGTGVKTLLLYTPPVETAMQREARSKVAPYATEASGPVTEGVPPARYAAEVLAAIDRGEAVLGPEGPFGDLLASIKAYPGTAEDPMFAARFRRV